MPSKSPAAVAAALRPPKSMDAAPPIIACAPLTNTDSSGRHSAAAHGPTPTRSMSPNSKSTTAMPAKPKKMTGARRPLNTRSDVMPKAKPPAIPKSAMPHVAVWYGM